MQLSGFRRLVVRHELVGEAPPAVVLDRPERVAWACGELLSSPQEVFLLICVDVKKHLVAAQELFRGTVDACIVHPREVFRSALLLAPTVAGVIVADDGFWSRERNGDPQPPETP